MEISVKELTMKSEVLNRARVTVWKSEFDMIPTSNFMEDMYKSEHSPIRDRMFTIKIRGVKSWLATHFVRHHEGYTPYVSTQRDDRLEYNGIRDDRRQGELVNMDITLNAQAFINVSRKRMCGKAHPEAQALWTRVLMKLKDIDEELYYNCVPECVYRNGLCPEPVSCGRVNTPLFIKKIQEYTNKSRLNGKVADVNMWKTVIYNGKEYPLYKVNVFGDVMGQYKILNPSEDKDGYLHVTLLNDDGQVNATVHRIVACTFIENNASKPMINHIDNNRKNNYVGNLEWCTAKENISHSASQGRMLGNVSGEKNGNSKLTREDVVEIKRMLRHGKTLKEIGMEFGVHIATVSDIKCGNTWKEVE